MKPTLIHIAYSGLGGTTDYVFNLINGDVANEFDHLLIFYGIEEPSESTIDRANKIDDLKIEVIVKGRGLDKKALKRLKNLIHEHQPTAVTLHVNSLIAHIKKYIPQNCQLLFVEHQANHLKSRKERLWSALAQRKAHKVVSLTEDYQELLQKRHKLVYKSAKNVVISTGIDLSLYPSEIQQRAVKNIGMISRINEFRDHETLLKAFQLMADEELTLHIAGDGPLLGELKSKYSSDNIKFHGELNHDQIKDLLAELDIYVHATFGETSSVSIMQAQASALPVIASNVDGVNNVINSDNGLLVSSRDVDFLKNAIENLRDNDAFRMHLAECSLQYAEKNLSHIRMFENYKALLS